VNGNGRRFGIMTDESEVNGIARHHHTHFCAVQCRRPGNGSLLRQFQAFGFVPRRLIKFAVERDWTGSMPGNDGRNWSGYCGIDEEQTRKQPEPGQAVSRMPDCDP